MNWIPDEIKMRTWDELERNKKATVQGVESVRDRNGECLNGHLRKMGGCRWCVPTWRQWRSQQIAAPIRLRSRPASIRVSMLEASVSNLCWIRPARAIRIAVDRCQPCFFLQWDDCRRGVEGYRNRKNCGDAVIWTALSFQFWFYHFVFMIRIDLSRQN